LIRIIATSAWLMWMLWATALVAQVPQVPEKLFFGAMELHIDTKARSEIQEDVNRLHRHPGYFQSLLDRVNLYFPTIERVLAEERVPDPIKYLVIQESSLVSDAVSVSNAVGFWQFKMASAQEVGMRVDREIDERMHIEAATRGAARYLKRNNARFDNWIYAVLAYNVGPGGALSLVDKSLYGTSKMPINTRTHWYVKKFLAHWVAFDGLTGRSGHPQLQLHLHTVAPGTNLKQVAADFQMEAASLEAYNKWLKTTRIPGDKPYQVVLPIPHSNAFAIAKLNGQAPPVLVASASSAASPVPSKPKTPATRFVLKNNLEAISARAGDTQKSLANEGGISRAKLRRFNDLLRKEPIQTGQVYYLERKNRKAEVPFHTFQQGESLWEVSQAYGIRLNRLLHLNRLDPTEAVKSGRRLHLQKRLKKKDFPTYIKISPTQSTNRVITENQARPNQNPGGGSAQVSQNTYSEQKPIVVEPVIPPGAVRSTYTVQRGDTYFGIAAKLGVAVDDLLMWNNANAGEPLRVGQSLLVFKTKDAPAVNRPSSDKYYEVQPGDTLYSISRKTGAEVSSIRKWNQMTSDTIHPGQKLVVRP